MRKKNRSFRLMALLSASLLVSMFTIVQAQSPAAPAAKATNWSDPATWPNRILLRGPGGYQPCQFLAVVPRHPLRWALLQLLGVPQ
jgi:hypothetical protein